MKRLFKLSAISICLLSFSVSAVTLDYRHEYRGSTKTNGDRLKISHTTADGYFGSVEGKIGESTTTQDDGFSEGNGHFSGSGSEMEFGRNFKINDRLTLAPALNFATTDSSIDYRAQIKAIYKLSSNWMTTFKWRPGIEVSEKPGVADKNYNQFNWEFGYVTPKFRIMGDLEYRTTNYESYKGHHYNVLYNVSASYSIDKNWTPYTEIGYVPRYNSNHEADEMEMRYRLGIRYNF